MRIKFLLLTILTLNISCNMSQKKDNSTMFALIDTNKGTIKTELYFQQTPVTVANFVSLSEGSNKEVSDEYKNKKYYNGITFHRVISDFMIQGGDPTGTGSGSPGYSFKDEIVEELKKILKTVKVYKLNTAKSILPSYKKALKDKYSSLMVEYSKFM